MADHSIECNTQIVKYSRNVLRDGMTILVHCYSKAVIKVLKSASERGVRIEVITTDC